MSYKRAKGSPFLASPSHHKHTPQKLGLTPPQKLSAEPRNSASAEALAVARRPKETSFVCVAYFSDPRRIITGEKTAVGFNPEGEWGTVRRQAGHGTVKGAGRRVSWASDDIVGVNP